MMRGRHALVRWVAMIVLLLPACGEALSDEHVIDEPAHFEDGQITMTERAAERLDIQTAPIGEDGRFLVVPSSAVLVEPDGAFYVYTAPEPLVFVKASVRLRRDDAGIALLRQGPAAGTQVVTVGVPELYGIEYGMS